MAVEPANCTGSRWLSIIGLGEEGIETLSPVARRLVSGARLVVGGTRHLALAAPLITGDRLAWPSPLADALETIAGLQGEPVAVLASGDPFHYGIGRPLVSRFGTTAVLAIPQPSAFSLAASRMGWSLQDTTQVSLHGRALEGIVRHLQPGARILALSWDEHTPARLAELLRTRSMGRSRLTVLSAMGGPRETRIDTTAETFDGDAIRDIDPLNTVALQVEAPPDARIITLAAGLDDDAFEHDGQLTKREIRAVTLSALAPRQGELLWDIGLGAGSVAIEWLLMHTAMRAVGFEERSDRARRAARNAAALGTPELRIIEGQAPLALQGEEPPDAVFIGGGMSDDGVFDAAWQALKPGGRLVVNAVSLETEAKLLSLHGSIGGDLLRLQVQRVQRVGAMSGWKPALPVTQWRVVKQ